MSLDEIVILALVQGFCAVLPVSAWAHVLVIRDVVGWFNPTPPILFAAHLGTLVALLLYLWRDILQIAIGLVPRRKRRRDRGLQLAVNLAIASVPILLAGFAFNFLWGAFAPGLAGAAWISIGFGILFFAVDKFGMTIRRIEHMTGASALVLGIAGIVALVPGTSRVGMVVLAARIFGYERAQAARFGLMLSIPIMFASGPFGLHVLVSGASLLDWQILTAAAVACLAAFAGMASLMQWVSRERYTPLAVYSVVFGLVLLYWLYG